MSTGQGTAGAQRLSWGALVLALSLPAVLWLRGVIRPTGWQATSTTPALGDFGVVPDFSLIERSGRPLRRADLAGAPWLADFVYTRCEDSCPRLSAELARLHHRFGDRLRLVSFSVDPAHDTQPALAAYADRFRASDAWSFVTGDAAELRRLIGGGFHLAVADPPPGEAALAGTVTHSEKIALIDADLRIRRYYDGGSDAWLELATADLQSLGVTAPGAQP
jgi:protein SCO1/2